MNDYDFRNRFHRLHCLGDISVDARGNHVGSHGVLETRRRSLQDYRLFQDFRPLPFQLRSYLHQYRQASR